MATGRRHSHWNGPDAVLAVLSTTTFFLIVTQIMTTGPRLRSLAIKTAKVLIRLAMDAELRRDIERVYARLDLEMPNLLKESRPVQMTGSIASAIADVTGKKATIDQVDAIVALYNPIAATIRNLR